jgi:hypothetical protein
VTAISPIAPVSERFEVARLAREAALATPGVVAGVTGPHDRLMAEDRGRRLEGVVAVAEPGGAYDVDLFLRADLVPLPALTVAVEDRVRRRARAAGMERLVGEVRIFILDVAEPGGLQP